jgi:predicted nucleic acid-binding protein
MILADTSVWIEYLRGTPTAAADELDERLAAHDVLMCGPVATELLTGVDAADRWTCGCSRTEPGSTLSSPPRTGM